MADYGQLCARIDASSNRCRCVSGLMWHGMITVANVASCDLWRSVVTSSDNELPMMFRNATRGRYGAGMAEPDQLRVSCRVWSPVTHVGPEWACMAKVRLPLFPLSSYGPVWPVVSIFAPLLPLPFDCGKMRRVLPYVAWCASNGLWSLRMVCQGLRWSLMTK